ncbi:hypothetical protein [Streptomyces sp. NPDC052107]|uniref:hypothetical protein n=1 Tax=Streptomyces sp. NPDC052107 TaxID=3155632 RepID=UPI003414DB31
MLWAGLAILPQTAMAGLASALGGRLTARAGPRVPMSLGLLIGAAGFLALLTAGPLGQGLGSAQRRRPGGQRDRSGPARLANHRPDPLRVGHAHRLGDHFLVGTVIAVQATRAGRGTLLWSVGGLAGRCRGHAEALQFDGPDVHDRLGGAVLVGAASLIS